MSRRAPVALLTVLFLLGGCVSPDSRWVSAKSGEQGASPSTDSNLEWTECPDLAEELLGSTPTGYSYHCATLQVPQDWSTAADGQAADGETFDISLVRVVSADRSSDERVGSLVVNPGGPGGSGVDLAVYLSAVLPSEITDSFDIVGFDPRGVGRSTAVDCFEDEDLDSYFASDPDPGQADFDALAALEKSMVDACATKYGDALQYFSTEQTARDMDAVRAAVGDEKLTYLGYSYGTLIGAVYAHLFPQNVRALVLDGAIDPTQTSIEAAEDQAMGFERAFDNFSAWCAENTSRCSLGSDARSVVTSLLQSARTSPVATSDGREATAGWVLTGIVSSLYSQSSWTSLAKALQKLGEGDANTIMDLADSYAERDSSGNYTNLFDANAVINCTDDGLSPTVEQVRQLQEEWGEEYPMFGSALALNLMCAQWPGERDPYPTGEATGSSPILVVGTTGDPATPYENASALAEQLGVGVLLTWDGEGHTAYPQTRCVVSAVDDYLIDLTVPEDGTTCPAS